MQNNSTNGRLWSSDGATESGPSARHSVAQARSTSALNAALLPLIRTVLPNCTNHRSGSVVTLMVIPIIDVTSTDAAAIKEDAAVGMAMFVTTDPLGYT